MQQPRRIRNIVTSYTSMPGLIVAAIGLYAAVSGGISILFVRWLYRAIEAAYPVLANIAATLALFFPYILFVLALYGISRYYQRTFGQVKPGEQVQGRLFTEIVIAGLAYWFFGLAFDLHFHSPVSTSLLVVAAFLVAHWWLLARQQPHFLVLAAIVIILSFVPLFNANVYHWLYMDTAPDWYYNNINICTGLVLMLAGLLSHRHLVRALTQVRESIIASSASMQRKEDVYS